MNSKIYNQMLKQKIENEEGFEKNLSKTKIKKNDLSHLPEITPFSHEVQLEREYLQKLKVQRGKTQKLYELYIKLKQDKEKLEGENQEELKARCQLIENQRRKIDEIQTQKQLYRQENEKLKRDLEVSFEERTIAISQVKEHYTKSLEELKGFISRLKQSGESKEKQLKNIKTTHANQLKQMEEGKERLREELLAQTKKRKNLEEKVIEVEEKRKSMMRKIQEIERENKKITMEISFKNQQINSLKQMHERGKIEVDHYSLRVEELEEKVALLEDEIRSRQNQVLEEKYEKQTLKKKIQENKDWSSRIQRQLKEEKNRNQTITKEKDQIIQNTKKQIEKLEKQNSRQKIEEYEKQIALLIMKVESEQKENEILQKLIDEKKMLQRERKQLLEVQMEQIAKFQNLLRDVN